MVVHTEGAVGSYFSSANDGRGKALVCGGTYSKQWLAILIQQSKLARHFLFQNSQEYSIFKWQDGPVLKAKREYPGAVLLSNGTWWLIGGEDNGTIVESAEM